MKPKLMFLYRKFFRLYEFLYNISGNLLCGFGIEFKIFPKLGQFIPFIHWKTYKQVNFG